MRAAWAAAHRPLPDVPRWAARVALAIQLSVLPSSLWRIVVVTFHVPIWDGGRGSGDLPWWLPLELYVVILSLVSELLAFAAFGLVCRWGEVWPRWVPLLRGRRVPPVVAVMPAALGSLGLTVLWTWTIGTATLGYNVRGERLADNPLTLETWEGAIFALAYVPLVLWGPLLAVLTVHYYRRRRSSAAAARPVSPSGRPDDDATPTLRGPGLVPRGR
jgi:hypothetical protein